MRDHDLLEPRVITLLQRLELFGAHWPRVLPSLTVRAHLLDQVGRGGLGRRERFELVDQRFTRVHALGERDLIALLVPFEEVIARAAEAVPERLSLVLADRAHRLPLGLQP